MNSSLCPYGNNCTCIHPLSYHWQQRSWKIWTRATHLTLCIPVLKVWWCFGLWRRRHSSCGRDQPPHWLQQAWDKYGVESTTIKQHILFPAQTIFSQTIKSLFLAAAVLFLDLVPMVLTVWSHIYFTGSFKEISGRVAGTSCPLRRMDWVSFCRAIALKLVPMKVWRFFSGPGLVGENPISPWRTHISLGRSLLSLHMIK